MNCNCVLNWFSLPLANGIREFTMIPSTMVKVMYVGVDVEYTETCIVKQHLQKDTLIEFENFNV